MTQDRTLWLLFFLASLLLLVTVGSYGVIESSDARYAEIAREMYVSGDWLHPNLLDVHHYHKPPLTYQITALGYKLFGINAFGARFFLQIAIVLQMLLVYLLTLQFTSHKKVALWAAAIYFSFPMVLIASRNLTTDTFLTTFTLLGIYAWVRYRKEGKFRWLYVFTLSLAFGFLTKGPVVFLAPVVFALLFNRLEIRKQKWSLHHIVAWSIFVMLSASWFIYLALDNPAFWNYFIERQTVERFSKNVFNRSEPFWYFIVLTPLLGMPWVLLLPWLVKKTKVRFTLGTVENILLFSVLIPLVFFSISTSKRVLYILPLYPLLAVFIALMLSKLHVQYHHVVLRFVFAYAAFVFTALGVAPWIPGKITFPELLTPLSLFLLVFLFWFWRQTSMESRNKSVFISFVTAGYFLLSATALFSHSVQSFRIASPVAAWIKENHVENREILVYNKRLPSLAFEMNRSIVSLYDGDRTLNREVQFEKDNMWQKYLYNITEKKEKIRLQNRLKSTPSVLISYKKVIPPKHTWLKEYYRKHTVIGKWNIYY